MGFEVKYVLAHWKGEREMVKIGDWVFIPAWFSLVDDPEKLKAWVLFPSGADLRFPVYRDRVYLDRKIREDQELMGYLMVRVKRIRDDGSFDVDFFGTGTRGEIPILAVGLTGNFAKH